MRARITRSKGRLGHVAVVSNRSVLLIRARNDDWFAPTARIPRRDRSPVVPEMRNLIERFGADIRLPDLREEIANCSRRGQWHDGCMVRYVDLVR